MGLLDALFGNDPATRARRLLKRAFDMVERARNREDLERARPLLEEASRLDPDNPHVWNELAFVCGHTGHIEIAVEAGRHAVRIEPDNAKFHNAVLGNREKLIMRAKSRAEAGPQMRQLLVECEALLARFASYPPLHLCHADLLAATGAPEADWSRELDRACALYTEQDRLGSGMETNAKGLANVLRNGRERCQSRADWWRKLPETASVA